MNSKCFAIKATSGFAGVFIALVFVLMLVLAPVAVHAQSYAGSVRGTVTDPSGAAVPGAKITLRDVCTSYFNGYGLVFLSCRKRGHLRTQNQG